MGTPVEIFDIVAAADRVICLGNIEYHYFAGCSDGAKAIMPGVSTASAIQANHSKMVEETSAAGRIKGNNVRADIDSIADFIKIDFILNVVMDEKKRIIKAVAGHYIQAHREGIRPISGTATRRIALWGGNEISGATNEIGQKIGLPPLSDRIKTTEVYLNGEKSYEAFAESAD